MSVVQPSILSAIYRGFPRPRHITCNFKLEQQTNLSAVYTQRLLNRHWA